MTADPPGRAAFRGRCHRHGVGSGRRQRGHRDAPAELRDGSRVRIRQARRTDRDLLVRGFERLGPESRYRRFLTPMHELDARTLRY